MSTVKAEEFKESAVKSMFKSLEVQEFRDSMNNSVKSTRDGKRFSQPSSPKGEAAKKEQEKARPGSGDGHNRGQSASSMSVDLDEEEKAK